MLAEIHNMDRDVSVEDTGNYDQIGAIVRESFRELTGGVSPLHLEGAYVGAMLILGRTLGLAQRGDLEQEWAQEFAYIITEIRVVLARLYQTDGSGTIAGLEASWNI
jgi:hypothetical protein